MMKSKKIFRILVILVAFITVALLFLVSGDDSILVKIPSRVRPTSNVVSTTKSSQAGGFWESINFLNNQKLPSNFPLSELLTSKEIYKKEKLTLFTDPSQLINKQAITDDKDIDKDALCPQIKFEDDIQITDPKLLEADYDTIQKHLHRNKAYLELIEKAEQKFKSKVPKEKQWFRFAGSSVWLEGLDVHFMVSRLIYSPSGIPNKGFASFLYVQIFNRDWEEIHDTINLPYEQLVVQNNINSDGSMDEKVLDKTVAYREVQFPSLLPIEFGYLLQVDNGKYYYGPEDPRIIKRLHPTFGFEEPIIVFNMKDMDITKRVMHMYLPFSNKLKMLVKRSEPFAGIEKNWTPFKSTRQTSDKLNFMYSINPLEVLVCEVETGMCDFIQKMNKDNINYFGPLRGGSQLEQLPLEDLPDHIKRKFKLPENRSIYIGWARTHLNKCGCGESMYRPNLIILIEDYKPDLDKYYYKIGHVSDFIDFNSNIPPWQNPQFDDDGKLIEDKKPICDKSLRNVLIPNSIAYWKVDSILKDSVEYNKKVFGKVPQTDGDIYINDFMGITLSAADSDVSVVHVKGLLNVILKVQSLYDEGTVVDGDLKFNQKGFELNEQCSEVAAKEYCVKYAEMNGGLVEY